TTAGSVGDVNLTADRVNIGATATINAGTHSVTLTPLTPGTAIDLGGADGPGTLGLTDAELDAVTAGTLFIGNGSTGTLSISAAITPAGTGTLVLQTGGDITEARSIAVAKLSLSAAGNVFMNGGNDVDVLAASLSGSGKAFTFADVDDVTVGTVGFAGVTTNGGNVTLTAQGTGGLITVNQPISTGPGSGGTLTLTQGDAINATLTVGAGGIDLEGSANQDFVVNASSSYAAPTILKAVRDIIFNASLATTGGSNSLTLDADSDNDGVGGVIVNAGGQVVAAGALTVQASDVFATTSPVDSVNIANDGANTQVQAGGAIQLLSKAAAPAAANILVAGVVSNAAGSITIDSKNTTFLGTTISAAGDISLNDALVLTANTQLWGVNVTFASTINDDGSAA